MALAPGSRLGPYEILSRLGAGGMGEVYRARDTRLGREVAVKVLPQALAEDARTLDRFEREARAVAALSHPNILAIYDVGRDGASAYVVTELLEGESLRDRLASGPLPPTEAMNAALQIASGLAAAHAKGIVHRDLKPENVFITLDGRAKLLDFGIAARLTPESEGATRAPTAAYPTEPGTVLGTPGYMSPEQIRGEPADRTSDVFSFGIVLYEMFSGRHPFRGGSAPETMAAILREDPAPLPGGSRSLPSGLERLIRHCLEKGRERRFQSVQDLLFDLENLSEAASPTESRPDSRLPSIAVLPFIDMSPGRDQAYFCEGMAEELINALTRIEGLRVASRTSSFQFSAAGADIRAIGERLAVGTILEGSLRKAGERLRITAQLINVVDGYHLWSDRFDRELKDVFAVQEEIAEQIVLALRVMLGKKDEHGLVRVPTRSVEAYDFYLRGRQLIYEMRRPSLERARQMFVRATEIDPAYALAYAGIADVNSFFYMWWESSEESLKAAEDASRRALELAPGLAEAHAARGLAASLANRSSEAEREFEAALALNPKLFEAQYFAGRAAVARGDIDQAIRRFEETESAHPDEYSVPFILAQFYRARGQQAECLTALRRGLRLAERYIRRHPDEPRPLYLSATALAALGERERAFEWAERALAIDPTDQATLYNLACFYAVVGDTDRALDLLERTVEAGSGHKEWIEHDGDLQVLHGHPRFTAVLDSLDRQGTGTSARPRPER